MTIKRLLEEKTLPEYLKKDLEDVKIVEGCDGKLELWSTEGDVNVEWFKGDNRIEISDKYVVKTVSQMHSLVVTNTDLTDRGIYTAKILGYERSARLDIEEYFTKNMKKDVDCIEGDTLELACAVLEDRVPAVWEKDGVIIKQSTKYIIKDIGKSHMLSIIQTDMQDVGTYSVKVNNRTRWTSLHVKEYFTQNMERTVECIEGDIIELSCSVIESSVPAVWAKDEIIIQQSAKYRIKDMGNSHTLSVIQADLQDVGNYSVIINNRVRSASLKVKEYFLKAIEKSTECMEGDNIELTCSVIEENVPACWEKNGVIIQQSTKYNIKTDGKNHILFICQVDVNDAANYTVNINNRTRSASLKVKELPETVKGMPEKDKHKFIELIKSGVKTEKRFCFRTVIVGKNGAGKTCLRRRLMKETMDDILTTSNDICTEDLQPKSSTDGVDIDIRTSRIPIKDGEVVNNADWIIDNDENIEMKHRLSMAYVQTTKPHPNTELKTIRVIDTTSSDMEETMSDEPLQAALKPQDHKESKEAKFTRKKPEYHATEADKTTELQEVNVKGEQLGDEDAVHKEIQSNDDMENHLLKLLDNLDLDLPHKITEDEYAFSRLWDLSGQKHFYATHQIFLTCAAIYLLTVDLSDEIKKTCNKDSHYHYEDFQDVGEYIDFWLDSIHCYSSAQTETHETSIEPPVIVVCTHTDKYEAGIKLKNRQEEYDSYFCGLVGGQGKASHITEDIIYLSNTNDTDDIFVDLRHTISTVARKMKVWGDELPQKWILLEKAIEHIRTEVDVVRMSFILNVGKHNFVGIDNEDEIKLFLIYQHKLGNIIFFSEKHLEEFVILNPTWLIDAFKCIVSHKISMAIKLTEDWGRLKETGIMTVSLLDKLLEKDHRHDFLTNKDHLVKSLEKFDILIPVNNTNSFYIPSMMRKMELSILVKEIISDPSAWMKTSWLLLKFEFLPPPFFQHILAFFAKKFLPNYRNKKPDLYRGIGVFNLELQNSPEKLIICVSLNMIALQGLVCTSKGKDFSTNYNKIRLQLEKIVFRIKRRYNLNIHHWIELRSSDKHNEPDGVTLEDIVYMETCGSQYNNADTNHDPREIYYQWFAVQRADVDEKNTENICLKHNTKWKSSFEEFLQKIQFWNVRTFDAVCTCSAAHDKVWNNVTIEQIAVAHEIYKRSIVFRTSTVARKVSIHEEFYSELLEKDMFRCDTDSSADRLIYVLFIEAKGFNKCKHKEMFTWTIFEEFKETHDQIIIPSYFTSEMVIIGNSLGDYHRIHFIDKMYIDSLDRGSRLEMIFWKIQKANWFFDLDRNEQVNKILLQIFNSTDDLVAKGIAMAPVFGCLFFLKGKLLLRIKKPVDALEDLIMAKKLFNEHKFVRKNSLYHITNIYEKIAQAYLMFMPPDINNAINYLLAAFKTASEDGENYNLHIPTVIGGLGRCYYVRGLQEKGEGNKVDAKKLFEKSVAYYNKAMALDTQMNLHKYDNYAEKLVKRAESHVELGLLNVSGALSDAVKDIKEAYELRRKILQPPNYKSTHTPYLVGKILCIKGKQEYEKKQKANALKHLWEGVMYFEITIDMIKIGGLHPLKLHEEEYREIRATHLWALQQTREKDKIPAAIKFYNDFESGKFEEEAKNARSEKETIQNTELIPIEDVKAEIMMSRPGEAKLSTIISESGSDDEESLGSQYVDSTPVVFKDYELKPKEKMNFDNLFQRIENPNAYSSSDDDDNIKMETSDDLENTTTDDNVTAKEHLSNIRQKSAISTSSTSSHGSIHRKISRNHSMQMFLDEELKKSSEKGNSILESAKSLTEDSSFDVEMPVFEYLSIVEIDDKKRKKQMLVKMHQTYTSVQEEDAEEMKIDDVHAIGATEEEQPHNVDNRARKRQLQAVDSETIEKKSCLKTSKNITQ